MRALILAAVVIVGGIGAAEAQSGCRTVEVERVALRRVQLFDLRQTPVTEVSRRQLGEITRAVECPSTPDFLGIESRGRRWLVRRTALQLRGVELNLPICAPGQYESYIERNASGSGAGLPPCRRASE